MGLGITSPSAQTVPCALCGLSFPARPGVPHRSPRPRPGNTKAIILAMTPDPPKNRHRHYTDLQWPQCRLLTVSANTCNAIFQKPNHIYQRAERLSVNSEWILCQPLRRANQIFRRLPMQWRATENSLPQHAITTRTEGRCVSKRSLTKLLPVVCSSGGKFLNSLNGGFAQSPDWTLSVSTLSHICQRRTIKIAESQFC